MPEARILSVRKKIPGKNEQPAQELRGKFARHGVYVANLVSSPGAGNTELLRWTMALKTVISKGKIPFKSGCGAVFPRKLLIE